MKWYGWIAVLVFVIVASAGFWLPVLIGGPLSDAGVLVLFFVAVVVGALCGHVGVYAHSDWKKARR